MNRAMAPGLRFVIYPGKTGWRWRLESKINARSAEVIARSAPSFPAAADASNDARSILDRLRFQQPEIWVDTNGKGKR